MIEQDMLIRRAMIQDASPVPERIPAHASSTQRRGSWRDAVASFVVTGGMAAAALAITTALDLRPWVLFLAWVGYGLLGASPRAGGRLLIGFVMGAAAGMVTVLLGSAWAPWLGDNAMPLALGTGCGLLAALEKRPPLDIVPAYFLGMIAFFAAQAEPGLALLRALAVPAALGVAWGWSSALLQGAVGRRLGLR